MMNALNQFTVRLIEEQCYKCSVWFGLDSGQRALLLERGGTFYCPNGHPQAYTTTEVTKLKQRVASLESWSKTQEWQLQHEKSQHAATKGKLTKTKNRIARGVCPCCNRTFVNLQQHIMGQHPEYDSTAVQSPVTDLDKNITKRGIEAAKKQPSKRDKHGHFIKRPS
jgi:hypothetical protein